MGTERRGLESVIFQSPLLTKRIIPSRPTPRGNNAVHELAAAGPRRPTADRNAVVPDNTTMASAPTISSATSWDTITPAMRASAASARGGMAVSEMAGARSTRAVDLGSQQACQRPQLHLQLQTAAWTQTRLTAQHPRALQGHTPRPAPPQQPHAPTLPVLQQLLQHLYLPHLQVHLYQQQLYSRAQSRSAPRGPYRASGARA